MANKKSYMNKENILSEGWISDIISKIVKSWKKRKKDLKIKVATDLLTKHKGFQGKLKNLNKSTDNLEKMLQDLTGEPIKLNKYELGDFIR